MNKVSIALAAALTASGCAASSAVRVSQNETIIQTRAAPICGGVGAVKVAQKQAAIETIKAGYDRYIIVGAAGADTTRVVQMPGTYNTFGTANTYGNQTTINATTTYQHGPTFVAGGHSQSLGVRMFREGEPGASRAVSAREVLGPKWPEIVKGGVHTCAG